MQRILPDRDIDAVLVANRRADDFARATVAAIGDRLAGMRAILGRIAVALPNMLEDSGLPRIGVRYGPRVEGIANAVAAAIKNERPPVDDGQRRAGPRTVKNAFANVRVIDRDEPSGFLIERDQRPGVRIRDILVHRLRITGAEED